MKSITLKDGTEWELNTAYHGDCLEFMKRCKDDTFSLCLTDPPYGIGADKGIGGGSKRGAVKKFSGDWDNKSPDKKMFEEIFRISKHQIIWGGNYFSKYLSPVPSWAIWDKREGLPERTFADCEMAWMSFKSPARIFRHKWDGMIQENMKNKEIRIHPTQKPLRVIKWCLEKYAPENALVFDPFLGSFTTAVACHHYGLNWIGCEKDDDYFKAGMERYNREIEQPFFDFGI